MRNTLEVMERDRLTEESIGMDLNVYFNGLVGGSS